MCGLQKHLQPVEGFKQAIWALAVWWRRWHTFAFQLFQSLSNLPVSEYWGNFNKDKKKSMQQNSETCFSSQFEQACVPSKLFFFFQCVFGLIYFPPKENNFIRSDYPRLETHTLCQAFFLCRCPLAFLQRTPTFIIPPSCVRMCTLTPALSLAAAEVWPQQMTTKKTKHKQWPALR